MAIEQGVEPLDRLTRREREVLTLVAEGLTSAEVASLLVLSERTVHAHLRAVFAKLGVRTRTAAARAWCDQTRTFAADLDAG